MTSELKRSGQTTEIYLNKGSQLAVIRTYSTRLIDRLKAFSESCPELCRLTGTDCDGGMTIEVEKHCLSIRLIKPHSAERRQAAR